MPTQNTSGSVQSGAVGVQAGMSMAASTSAVITTYSFFILSSPLVYDMDGISSGPKEMNAVCAGKHLLPEQVEWGSRPN
jgi:hypothetical protein